MKQEARHDRTGQSPGESGEIGPLRGLGARQALASDTSGAAASEAASATGAVSAGPAADRAGSLEGLSKVMVDWTAEEVADFAVHLSRLNRDVERLDGRPWPRD
ncbi:hypothetical protein RB628_04525 [Streptomyces sp. ADMS]|uniref:hypothetical protein n=1 Tax=Streptomyces sp. ADMS TaxID=3071415 RepID=UPI00296FC1DB|nr:hypothetical protein [Streptomyces sp. ADMS]MDW4904626.1 hypothetical protein [Streptomyces sp. ADMS]